MYTSENIGVYATPAFAILGSKAKFGSKITLDLEMDTLKQKDDIIGGNSTEFFCLENLWWGYGAVFAPKWPFLLKNERIWPIFA